MITSVSITAVLDAVQKAIPPLWPLKDYVAVNPFLGFTEHPFLDAKRLLDHVRDASMMMPITYFQKQYQGGKITDADIEAAISQCRHEYAVYYEEMSSAAIIKTLTSTLPVYANQAPSRIYHTAAERVDEVHGTSFTEAIVGEVSRHVAAHYDEGQALWASPWKNLSLYNAWLETAKIDRRAEKLGIKDFRSIVAKLPKSPVAAIESMLAEINVPADHVVEYLQCQLFSVAGWASYVKYRVRQDSMAGTANEDLIGLLAIVLAYDVAVIRCAGGVETGDGWPSRVADSDEDPQPADETLIRYALQVASEIAYRRLLVGVMAGNRRIVTSNESIKTRSAVQMVFCIDVRSEIIRRNLEAVSKDVETFGFAGFFALAMEYVALGEDSGAAQCPVLLSPGFTVHEGLRGEDEFTEAAAEDARRNTRLGRGVWKSFQSSATSTFSFVESWGVFYAYKLITDTLGLTRPVEKWHYDGIPIGKRRKLGPVLNASSHGDMALEKKIQLGEGILHNLGLRSGLGRLVVLCGHGSETANNPYKAGLDCGACGGHTGESNARVGATILNDPGVRRGLGERGIVIPQDTVFVAALHITTTDEILFFDKSEIPETHQKDLAQLKNWVAQAGDLARVERASRMRTAIYDSVTPIDLVRRSRDWSEVRPEWGLAGNAAFIVAPRDRTETLKLDGRTFMHSYEFSKDTDLKVLELIMTAPMVVTNWINLQYYASSVDNVHYGSGNKTIHNVVGQLGVVLGMGGDLMTGLPWQSVHDGTQYQHEPLRLFVMIDAPRDAIQSIIDKHAGVRDLVLNGWLTVASIHGDEVFQLQGDGEWTRFAA